MDSCYVQSCRAFVVTDTGEIRDRYGIAPAVLPSCARINTIIIWHVPSLRRAQRRALLLRDVHSCTFSLPPPPLYRGDITRIILFFGATLCVTPFTEHNARYLLLLLLRDVLVAPFLSLCPPPPFCTLGDIIRIFFGATLCVYTGLVWLPRYSLLLPDDGQVPKRCNNNGTGSDVMCSAMGMGVSTRILLYKVSFRKRSLPMRSFFLSH